MALTKKKIILTFIGNYLPGYKAGGAMRILANMVNYLSDQLEFKIITRDRDLFEDKPYNNIKINAWNSFPKSMVFYFNMKLSLKRIINDTTFDIYYLNSLFDYHFSIKIILLRKLGLIPQKEVVLAPQGELMNGALSVKPVKKRIYILLSRIFGIYSDITWHASSENEANDIKREYGDDVKIKIAHNMPDFKLQSVEPKSKKEKNKLKILFISVISPKKNLSFVIDVLNKVQGDFTLNIYGPIKDQKYWEGCLRKIDGKIKDKINYKGVISHNQINTVYPNYDLFFFPTLGESFGHVIYESLVFGCPVLCSDTTPWNDLEKFDAGWNFNLNQPSQFLDLIEELISLDQIKYDKFFIGCKSYVEYLINDPTRSKANVNLFN